MGLITSPSHGLALGSLPLVKRLARSESWTIDTLGDDVSFGSPAPVEVVLRPLLIDGSQIIKDRDDNRDVSFSVVLEAPDGLSLGAAEKALAAEVGRANTLTWTPPDGFGKTSVFDVVTSRMDWQFDDFDELRLQRVYRLTLTCLPFSRPETEATFTAGTLPDSATTVDECQSTSGWSSLAPLPGDAGPSACTFAVDSTAGNFTSGTGSMKVTPSVAGEAISGISRSTVRFSKSLSATGSAGGYLVADIKFEWSGTYQGIASKVSRAFITTSSGGRQEVQTLASGQLANGFIRHAWLLPDGSTITGLELQVLSSRISVGTGTPSVWVDAIGVSASAGTGYQQVRTIDVAGSARSTGSLSVESTAGLGEVLLWTGGEQPSGFRPDLKRWLTTAAGGIAADSGAITGTRVTPQTSYTAGSFPVVMSAPASIFADDDYVILARGKATSGVNNPFQVEASLMMGSTVIGQPVETLYISGADPFAATNTWEIKCLGTLRLPPVATDPASGATVRFRVQGNAIAVLDELWAFPASGSLTWAKCGSGAASASVSSKLWVDGPSLARPLGGVFRGTQSNRYDSRAVGYPDLAAHSHHILDPSGTTVYLVATGATGAALSGRYFPRFHDNVA